MAQIKQSYILSGPSDDIYDLPKGSVGKYLYECLKSRDPNDVINIDPVSNRILKCGQLLEKCLRMIKVFKYLKITKGDTICIMTENSFTYCIPVVAALLDGITIAPLNPAYVKGELRHSLNLSKPKAVICSRSTLDEILEAKTCLDYIETVILTGSPCEGNPEVYVLEDLLEATTLELSDYKPEEFDCSEQIAFICLSSGTTGLPKGVMITHENFRMAFVYTKAKEYGNFVPADTTVLVLPLFHIFGIIVQLSAIVTYMKVVILEKFIPDIFLKSIQDYKVTKLFLVPPLLLFLTKSPLVAKYDLSSIKDILIGAAPLGENLQDVANKLMKDAAVRQTYGLTEASGATSMETTAFHKSGSVGVLVPGVEAKIVDVTTGTSLGPYATGELCFRGNMIMKGYATNEQATYECIDEEGYLHSGDVGYYDDEEYLFIVGRSKELIKYKGFQVAPSELEALINSHPLVKDCGVIGIPDDRSGELPFAFVVLQDGANLTEKDVIDFVGENISIQKRLYGGVRFVSEIRKTASGKILRTALNDMLQANN